MTDEMDTSADKSAPDEPRNDAHLPSAPTPNVTAANEPPVAARSGSNWFRRFFWLDEKIAEAQANGFGPAMAGWKEFELARDLCIVFEEIKESGENRFHLLLLLRAQVLLLIRCLMQRHGIGVPEDSPVGDNWVTVRQLPAIEELWNNLPVSQVDKLEAALGSQSEVYITNLDSRQRAILIESLRDIAQTLMAPLESDAGRVGRLMAVRWFRVGVTLAVLCMILLPTFGWALDRAGKVNLALHHPVTTSSQVAGFLGADHRLLVDGDRTNLGFHTESLPNQFVVVDLGSIKKFDKVVVYNRADCCKERAVPMRLEVSDDGVNYSKLDERKEVFDVWTAKMLHARGRYVRLRLLQTNVLHLSEVEVY